jgi:hypothetical protein
MIKIKKPADFWAGVLFLFIGTTALVMAFSYSIGTARRMGPGYFPAALGGLLCLLAVGQIVRSLSGVQEAMSTFSLKPVALILLASASFGMLLRPFGLIVAIFASVLISALASPSSRIVQALLLAFALATGSAIVFVHYLGQPMPLLGEFLIAGRD